MYDSVPAASTHGIVSIDDPVNPRPTGTVNYVILSRLSALLIALADVVYCDYIILTLTARNPIQQLHNPHGQ